MVQMASSRHRKKLGNHINHCMCQMRNSQTELPAFIVHNNGNKTGLWLNGPRGCVSPLEVFARVHKKHPWRSGWEPRTYTFDHICTATETHPPSHWQWVQQSPPRKILIFQLLLVSRRGYIQNIQNENGKNNISYHRHPMHADWEKTTLNNRESPKWLGIWPRKNGYQ